MEIMKAIGPTIGVFLLFWWVMRSIFRADRVEREQMDKFYAEHEREPEAADRPAPAPDSAPADPSPSDSAGRDAAARPAVQRQRETGESDTLR